jgi:uncharacterized protein (DUF433 family)
MPVLTTAHIRLDDGGVAWIDDANTKVIEVAQDMVAHGWSPEEIHFQHSHLFLAQIHAALAYCESSRIPAAVRTGGAAAPSHRCLQLRQPLSFGAA